MPELDVEQLIGKGGLVIQCCAGDEAIPGQTGEMIHLVEIQTTSDRYLLCRLENTLETYMRLAASSLGLLQLPKRFGKGG